MQITISFTTDAGEKHTFSIDTSDRHSLLELNDCDDYPEWTRLECHQCPHCPFDTSNVKWCPAAVEMIEIVKRFPKLISYEKVTYEFQRDNLYLRNTIDAQNALAAILSLKLTVSGCPALQGDNWSRKYFAPASDINHILFRRLAIRLICEHLSEVKQKSFEPYFHDEETMIETFSCLKARINQVKEIEADAIHNAVVLLHTLLMIIQNGGEMIYDTLEEEITANQ